MPSHKKCLLTALVLLSVQIARVYSAEPDAAEKIPVPEPVEPPAFKWPTVLRGVVKDVDGKPIAGAHVRFDFEKIHEYNNGCWYEPIDSQSQVTGDNGEYRFDASKLEQLTHRPFLLS